MSAETSFAEVFEDGLDYGYECVCGERVRGYATEPDARAAATEHERERERGDLLDADEECGCHLPPRPVDGHAPHNPSGASR